jgi:hypothetical protein
VQSIKSLSIVQTLKDSHKRRIVQAEKRNEDQRIHHNTVKY